jgi:hypothetical protein
MELDKNATGRFSPMTKKWSTKTAARRVYGKWLRKKERR